MRSALFGTSYALKPVLAAWRNLCTDVDRMGGYAGYGSHTKKEISYGSLSLEGGVCRHVAG